jgi:hypothetical protein
MMMMTQGDAAAINKSAAFLGAGVPLAAATSGGALMPTVLSSKLGGRALDSFWVALENQRALQFMDFLAWADGSSPAKAAEDSLASVRMKPTTTLAGAESAQAVIGSPRPLVQQHREEAASGTATARTVAGTVAGAATPLPASTLPPVATLAWRELSEQDKAFILQQLQTGKQPLSQQMFNELFPQGGRSLLEPLQGASLTEADATAAASARTKAMVKQVQTLLEQTEQSKRPIRIVVNDTTSLVMMIHQGRVSATFTTTDSAGLASLSQQVQELKSTLRQKALPVEDVLARDEGDQKRRRQQRQALYSAIQEVAELPPLRPLD